MTRDPERDLPPTEHAPNSPSEQTASTSHNPSSEFMRASTLDEPTQRPGDVLDSALPEKGKLPRPGQRIGDYHFLEVIGAGAFATVYLAEQVSLGRKVALKVATNVSSEAKTLASLEHEHVVPVYAETVDDERGLRLLCMKFVPGTDLDHVLKELFTQAPGAWSGQTILTIIDKQARHPAKFDLAAIREREELEKADFVEAACWIGTRLAEALAHAHSRHVLHRDVKPANVLLDRYGRPLLSDFNLAADTLRGLGIESFGGTLRYMAPEHLDAFNPAEEASQVAVGERSDLYSLGVVLYEMLTGQTLIGPRSRSASGPNQLKALAEDRRERAPSLRAHSAKIPTAVDRAIRRCLEPDPAARYQRAEDLAQALEGCRELRRAERNLPAPQVLTKLCLRSPVLLFIVLAFLPHLLGSAVNITYNEQAIVTKLTAAQKQAFQHAVLAYNLVAYPICFWLVCRLVIPIFRVYHRLQGSEPVTVEDVNDARRRCLILPAWIIVLSCVGWLPGGLLFPLSIDLFAGPVDAAIFGHFLFSFTVSGLIAATYSYFGIQFFVVRILYPQLWMDPVSPRERAREELRSLESRQRFFQFAAGLIPLSGAMLVLLIGPSEQFSILFRLLVVALISLGMAGFGAALMISSQTTRTTSVFVGGKGSGVRSQESGVRSQGLGIRGTRDE